MNKQKIMHIKQMLRKKFSTITYAFTHVYLQIIMICLPSLLIYIYTKDTSSALLSIIVNDNERMNRINALIEKFNFSHALVISLIVFYYITSLIRKTNRDRYYNANGNVYYDHWYITFWIASRILGYRKVQLVGIPLWLQYRIVLANTFDDIEIDGYRQHYTEYEGSGGGAKVEFYPNQDIKNTLNIWISDTYEISTKDIGSEYVMNPTVHIKSLKCGDKTRYNNPDLVNCVRKAVSEYMSSNHEVRSVYIFSTANPLNNLNIINSSFRLFGRFKSQDLYVVQMGEDHLYTKAHKILNS